MFRFTIRDVLWLTMVVALAVGWWLQRAEMARELEKHQAQVREMRAKADAAEYRAVMVEFAARRSVPAAD